jgi:hypothetical protein
MKRRTQDGLSASLPKILGNYRVFRIVGIRQASFPGHATANEGRAKYFFDQLRFEKWKKDVVEKYFAWGVTLACG